MTAMTEVVMGGNVGVDANVYLHAEEIDFSVEANFVPVEMDAPVRDANGAGDTLAVGFLTSYVLDGYPLRDAVQRGQIAARCTCTLKATSDHLIARTQLDHFAAQIQE